MCAPNGNGWLPLLAALLLFACLPSPSFGKDVILSESTYQTIIQALEKSDRALETSKVTIDQQKEHLLEQKELLLEQQRTINSLGSKIESSSAGVLTASSSIEAQANRLEKLSLGSEKLSSYYERQEIELWVWKGAVVLLLGALIFLK